MSRSLAQAARALMFLSVLLPAVATAQPAGLSAAQRDALRRLSARSDTPLKIDSAVEGATFRSIAMNLKPPRVRMSPEATARMFLNEFAPLWEFKGRADFEVTPAATCTVVAVIPRLAQGERLLNAGLSIAIDRDGRVRQVAGRLRPPREIAGTRKVSAADAKKHLLRYLRLPGLDIEPLAAVLDRSPRAAEPVWWFKPRGTVPGEAGLAISAVDGRLLTPVAIDGAKDCENEGPSSVWPGVVVDPHTQTPLYVDFGAGLPTKGADPVERAYSVFESGGVARMYGSAAPRTHLFAPKVTALPRGEKRVVFRQRVGNFEIEGAYAAVTLTAMGAARDIHSRLIYRPRVITAIKINGDEALSSARAAWIDAGCRGLRQCATRGGALAATAVPKLVAISSRLYQGTTLPPASEELAWRIEFPTQILYWSTQPPGRVLFAQDTRHASMFPFEVTNFSQGDRIEASGNGGTMPAAGIAPAADVSAIASYIATIDSFFTALNWNGLNNRNSLLRVHALYSGDANNAFWCTTASPGECAIDEMMVGDNLVGAIPVGGDVIAHEFTHGITRNTANLVYAGESGALNESYSDVFGNLAFPDTPATSWQVGENTTVAVNSGGPLRDMANPATGMPPQPGHVGNMSQACLGGGDRCVHEWSGVPNLAAVMAADGVPALGTAGIGRAKLAVLYLNVLTQGGIGTSTQFLGQQTATLAACWNFVRGNLPTGSPVFTRDDCLAVERAFHAVGIDPFLQFGWTRFGTGLFGTRYDTSFYTGLKLFRGCTIQDQILEGREPPNRLVTSNIASGLDIDMGGWGARVTRRGAATDATDRSADVHVWAEWFHEGHVQLDERYNVPAGLIPEDCLTPPPAQPGATGNHQRVLYSTTRVAHWATFLNGGRGDETVNNGITMPAGCQILDVLGVDYHSGAAQSPPVAVLDHGGHGFTVTRANPGDARDLSAKVHWWHEGTSGVFVRVQYRIAEDDNVNCAVPNATQDTP